MATENSPMRAPGIGKNSKRHDLDGTPGLSGSDLQYGDVQKLEAGQRSVANTRGAQGSAQGSVAPPPQDQPLTAPDPVQFATQKLGGGLPDVPTEAIGTMDTSKYLPLIRELATSGSSLLKASYMQMLQEVSDAPIQGAGTALIDRQAYDSALEQALYG